MDRHQILLLILGEFTSISPEIIKKHRFPDKFRAGEREIKVNLLKFI